MVEKRWKWRASLSAVQVLFRLADIELEGIEFYEGLAEGTESRWVRELSKDLIRAERRHRKRFLGYAAGALASSVAGAGGSIEPLPREVMRLLRASVFVSGSRIKKSARYASDTEALKVAIRAEENTALLLTRLREYVRNVERAYVTRVIKEEWAHKERLERVLAKISKA